MCPATDRWLNPAQSRPVRVAAWGSRLCSAGTEGVVWASRGLSAWSGEKEGVGQGREDCEGLASHLGAAAPPVLTLSCGFLKLGGRA